MGDDSPPPQQTRATAPGGGGGGLSAYASLLDPSSQKSSGTISSAPVRYDQSSDGQAGDEAAAARKNAVNAAALRFQPTKRPLQQSQKPKPRPTPGAKPAQLAPPHNPTSKFTLADFTAQPSDDENLPPSNYDDKPRRQRGGRRGKKKKAKDEELRDHAPANWDDVYDPTRPTDYADYIDSEEMVEEVREWKAKLHRRRVGWRRGSSNAGSEAEGEVSRNDMFAPPPDYSFAPPPALMDQPAQPTQPPPPDDAMQAPPPAHVPDDATGDDVFARRMRMSGMVPASPPSDPTQENQAEPADSDAAAPAPPPEPQAQQEATPPPPPPPSTISRAPVRYNLPPPPAEPQIPTQEDQAPAGPGQRAQHGEEQEQEQEQEETQRTSRPGQKNFAARLMAKYGWSKGQGLGASGNEGIVNPLRMVADKSKPSAAAASKKRKADSDDDEDARPRLGAAPTKGKIVGGNKSKAQLEREAQDKGSAGRTSRVVRLQGMLDGVVDLDAELPGLVQEIGDECADKYGVVERVLIHRAAAPGGSVPVFVKFTSELSGLRAVNALNGRVFGGNAVRAGFYPLERFDGGNLDA